MINKTDDELFSETEGRDESEALATPGKRHRFWPGDHDDWPPAAINESIEFINDSA